MFSHMSFIIFCTSLLKSSQSTASSFRAMKLSKLMAPPKMNLRMCPPKHFIFKNFTHTSCHICRIKSARSEEVDIVRADRLLSIVLLLQANHQMTSRELASRLEVSERTIHRDMEALSGAGIPVTAARGLDRKSTRLNS